MEKKIPGIEEVEEACITDILEKQDAADADFELELIDPGKGKLRHGNRMKLDLEVDA